MTLDLAAVLPAGMSAAQIGQMGALLGSLETDEHAPTAVRERDLAAYVHLADALAALEVSALREAAEIADLGAGAGFPGLALAVALPGSVVHLVESQRRKCEFLTRAIDAAEIVNARVVCARAEEWHDGLRSNEAITARALGPQPVVLEYAAPLLRVGGILVDWRGRRDAAEELAADRAGEELGMRRDDVLHVVPFPGARDRHLHVFRKTEETSPGFPRRPGRARKRPLGS